MKIINDIDAPQALIDALANDDYDGYNANTISVTSLIDSPYIQHLRKNYDSQAIGYASNMLFALDGSAVHYALERAGSKYIKEVRLEQDFLGLTISGKFDMYDPKTRILWDYKRTSVWTLIYNPEGKKEWIAQMNVNKWLMEAHDINPSELKILVFLKDWSKIDSITKRDYPKHPVMTVDIEIWNWEKLTGYLTDRVNLHKNSRNGAITPCTNEERWQKKTEYAVMKLGATRATRVFEELGEAKEFLEGKTGYEIKTRPGEFTRCERYCVYKPFCVFYKQDNFNSITTEETNDKRGIESLIG